MYDSDIDKEIGKFKVLEWKRASVCYKNPRVFDEDIHPNDISQGELGDCYFLSVLSALAEFPENVKALIDTKKVNSAGIYLLKFFVNGIPTPVIVDDHFPVKPNSTHICFAYSKDEELWVSLLEKGWAKLHGTYARVESGIPCFACSHLTGVPAESINHDEVEDKDKFW